MKKKSILVLTMILVLFSNGLFSQEEENFKPWGKINGTIFSNFHQQLFADNYESAFAVERAYLGYEHFLSENFIIYLKLDIGSPNQDSPYDILKRYAYFKNAAISYKKDKLTIHFGLIDTYHFKTSEKFWGHRYVYRTFQDEHKFGNSADLGASVKYDLNDFISVDFTVMNGEGYNQLQTDNTYKSALGITLKPIKNLTARFYADYIEQDEMQTTWSSFVGYDFNKKVIVGAEYNIQMNNKFVKDRNLNGFSGFASYHITEKWQIFGRYDKLWSNTLEGEPYQWNINKDGSAIIGGVQFIPHKNIRIAANYQDWYPYAKNIENETFFYLNLEYKF